MSAKPVSANMQTLMAQVTSRRSFIRSSTLAAVGASALAACDNKPQAAAAHVATATHGAAPVQTRADSVATMDSMHEAGIKSFPAKTEGKGNQLMQPRMVGNVKLYELTARVIDWEVEPGRKVQAWAYNDQVPGPQIRVREGDRVRVVLKNELPQSTVIHAC